MTFTSSYKKYLKEKEMTEKKVIKLVQAFVGAAVLTALMQLMGVVGYQNYIWMLFLPLLLFFALGADFKKIPSMIVGYICGVLWSIANGLIMGLMSGISANLFVSNILPTVVVIFLILTVHENFLQKTVFGNVPALFLGMSTTFFVFMLKMDITPLHLVAFYLYGIFLTLALIFSGIFVCSLIFGKEKAMKALAPAKGEGAEVSEAS